MYKKYFKRFIDLFFSIIIFITLSPLFIIIIILIKLDSPGPILFLQKRVGLNSKQISIYKFRTMFHCKRIILGQVFNDNVEITKIGKILRRLKIDELPQIFNVIKGDMSLVGPRPALPELYEKYPNISKTRILEKPGLTGWAQVNGNIYLPWEDRFKLDDFYIVNISFLLDIKIFYKTFKVILFGEEKYL